MNLSDWMISIFTLAANSYILLYQKTACLIRRQVGARLAEQLSNIGLEQDSVLSRIILNQVKQLLTLA
jgi:hypothetical protein